MTALARLWNELFPSRAQRERDSVLDSLHRKLKSAQARVREAYDYADGLVSDWELERELLRREPGYRGDRRYGDNWPYLTNMEDLRHYRGLSRQACEGNAYGVGFLDRAVDFVIGDGMQPVVTLRGAAKGAVPTGVADRDGDGQPDADERVQAVQGVIDDFRELNDWGCGTEDREEEGFRRSQRDGEVFVRFFRGGSDTAGLPRVRWVEPEQVDTPPSALPNERWGIRTDPDDVETREAFYVYDLADTSGEWVESSAMVWHKLGTDRTVLRGMPQFWLVANALSQCEKLNSAVAEVSAIQAQIAYVREHAPGILPGQITEFVGTQGDTTTRKPTPHGDRYRRVGYGENGTVVDMSAGTKFAAGPVSQGVPGFVSALQSRLRQVCARFGYPEFFSGDASNGNYASLLAAGGPAEKAFRRRQQRYASFQAAVYRRACEYAVESGRLRADDLSAVEVRVKPGKVSVSNHLEEAQVDQILIQNKVKSVQTAMLERGLDPRVETANITAWADKFEGNNGEPGPFGESYTEDEYEQLLHEYRAGLVLKVVGTHPKTGRPIKRWVRATPKQPGGKRPAATGREKLKATASELVQQGVGHPGDGAKLASSLKPLTPEELARLQHDHGTRTGVEPKHGIVGDLIQRAKGWFGQGRVAGSPIDYQHRDKDHQVVKDMTANPEVNERAQKFIATAKTVADHPARKRFDVAAQELEEAYRARDTLQSAGPDFARNDKLAVARIDKAQREFDKARDRMAEFDNTFRNELLNAIGHPIPSTITNGMSQEPIIIRGMHLSGPPHQPLTTGQTQVLQEAHEFVGKLVGGSQPISYQLAESKVVSDGIARAWGSEKTVAVGQAFLNTGDEAGHRAVAAHVHELGHIIEDNKRGVQERARAFVEYRCAGEDFTPMNDVVGGGYEDTEVGRKDQFDKAFGGDMERAYYAGKQYEGDSTEIVSLGLEQLYNDPITLAANDPEYFHFLVSVLS